MVLPQESHSREIRSKNKSVYENAGTGMEFSCMLLLIGSCYLLFYPIFPWFSSPGCLVESCYKRERTINSIQIIADVRGGGVRKGRAGDHLAQYLQQLSWIVDPALDQSHQINKTARDHIFVLRIWAPGRLKTSDRQTTGSSHEFPPTCL